MTLDSEDTLSSSLDEVSMKVSVWACCIIFDVLVGEILEYTAFIFLNISVGVSASIM